MTAPGQPGAAAPKQVLQAHPAPWQQVTYDNGMIRVFDAAGAEVGLISMLAFAIGVANASVRQPESTVG